MRRLIGLGLALLLLGACAASESKQAPGDAARGAILWAQSACVGCHGLDAEGSTAGPALIDTPLTLHDVIDIMRRGTPSMPPYPEDQISDDDLRDLYAWFLNPVALPAPTAAPTSTSGPTQAVGQDPWAESACAGCHGSSAQGGIGPSLAGTAQPFADFQTVVRRGAMGMPAFSESQMSEQTVRALYDWLQEQGQGQVEVAPAQPAVWVDALCGACHGAYAEGASAPGLTAEALSFDEFQRVVREGAEGMPPYDAGRVGDADVRAVYDWLLALHH
jgi:mono/diheme cytochrome c family protein